MSYLADRQRLYGSATPNVQSDPGGGGEDEGDWPNGFALRADIIIPATQIAATMSSVMVCVAVNVGANSENAGADIRFETQGGTVLDYALHRYATNVAYCVVRIPTLTASTQYKFHCYVGDSGATGQTNAAGAYAQFIAAWGEDGADLTGHGWTLTATGAGTGTLDSGFPCSTFDLGDIISSNAVLTAWDGLTGWTMEALVSRDTAAETATIFGAGSAPGFYTQYAEFALNQSGAGSSLVLASSSLVEGATSTYAVGPSNSAALLGETAYASSWAQGAAPTLYLGGAAQSALASAAQSAPTDIYPAQAGIRLGQRLDGNLAFVRVAGSQFPAAKIALHARSMRDPTQVYGIGAFYDGDLEGAPPVVALPLTANVDADSFVDINVAASAVTGGTPTLQSVTQGSRSGSSVTIESGVARYTPGGTAAGTDRFTATVSDGTNTSVARITVTIAAAGVAPPAEDWNEVAVSSYAELTAAVAAANPGDDIVLASGTYTGNLTISRSGTEGAPIRVRSATLNGARIIGVITVTGSHVIVQALKWQSYSGGNAIVDIYGDFVQVRGNQFIDCAVSNGAQRGAVRANAGANDGLIEYNEFRRFIQRAVCVRSANAGALRWTVRRNLFHTNIPSPGTLYSGIACGIGGDEENQTAWAQNMQCVVEYNYFTGIGGTDGNILQFKTSGCIARQNTAVDCPEGRMEGRRGGWINPTVYNQWIANTLINSRGPLLHGPGNIANSNYNDDQVTGNWESMGPASGNIIYTTINNQRPRAQGQIWVNNVGRLHLGNDDDDPYPALNTNVYNHTGTQVNTNSSGTTTGNPGIAAVTRVVLTENDVGPSQMPVEPVNATALELAANPFSYNSAFHRPIGTGATYADDSHASRVAWLAVVPSNNGQDGGGTIGAINQGHPFGVASIYASASDPLRTFTKRNCTDTGEGSGNWDPGGTSVQIRIPGTNGINTNAANQCYENTAFIVQADYTTHEFFQTNRSGDAYRASICRVADVRGLGHGSALGERVGVSASGCSVRMGMLAVGPLLAGQEIGHALKLAIYSGYDTEAYELLSRSIQWPACNADSFASNPANNTGPIPYGALLAIKPDVDLATLGLTTLQGYILGRAMQNYGCYAMDDANGIVLRADGSLGSNATAIVADYRKLLRHLRMVLNSVTGATAAIAADSGYTQTGNIGTPSYPAGGGTALATNTALVA